MGGELPTFPPFCPFSAVFHSTSSEVLGPLVREPSTQPQSCRVLTLQVWVSAHSSALHPSAPISSPVLYALENLPLFTLQYHFSGDSGSGEYKRVQSTTFNQDFLAFLCL